MNDLSSSYKRLSLPVTDHRGSASIEMASSSSGVNLDKLFEDAESVKEELRELEALRQRLHASHENSKNLSNAKAVKDLRSRMDGDVMAALKKAKVVKVRMEALDRSNAANLGVPGCGPGSSPDRMRTSVVNGLRKNLKETMESFNKLREKISSEYREMVQRRYFAVTGDNPDELTLESLISTGESETFLENAIKQQGSGQSIQEIQERHDAFKDIQKNLMELHQVFLDMAGDQVNDIDGKVDKVNRPPSFVQRTTGDLHQAKNRSGIWNNCCVHFLNCATMCVHLCSACA